MQQKRAGMHLPRRVPKGGGHQEVELQSDRLTPGIVILGLLTKGSRYISDLQEKLAASERRASLIVSQDTPLDQPSIEKSCQSRLLLQSTRTKSNTNGRYSRIFSRRH